MRPHGRRMSVLARRGQGSGHGPAPASSPRSATARPSPTASNLPPTQAWPPVTRQSGTTLAGESPQPLRQPPAQERHVLGRLRLFATPPPNLLRPQESRRQTPQRRPHLPGPPSLRCHLGHPRHQPARPAAQHADAASPAATQALVPALRCGQAARLKREAPAEIVPAHELAGHVLTAITARSGCDHLVFRLDDGTFAVVHLMGTPPRLRASHY